jgi:hypothetical protein
MCSSLLPVVPSRPASSAATRSRFWTRCARQNNRQRMGDFLGFRQGRKRVPTPVGIMRGRRAGRTGGVPPGYVEDPGRERDKAEGPPPSAPSGVPAPRGKGIATGRWLPQRSEVALERSRLPPRALVFVLPLPATCSPLPAPCSPLPPYFPSASEYAAARLTLPMASMLLGVMKNVVSSGVW